MMRIGFMGDVEAELYALKGYLTEKDRCDEDTFCKEVLAAIKKIRQEPEEAIEPQADVFQRCKAKIRNQLRQRCRIVLTLTKMRCKDNQQLRAWVDLPGFSQSDHVDGFSDYGIFEMYGSYRNLWELAEYQLSVDERREKPDKNARFDSNYFVMWIPGAG